MFGDGSDSGLYPLTKRRSGGAIPIAANYRLIDIVVSNCINSNITKIYALTQLNSTSLNSHLARAYSSNGLGKDGFVEVLAADQRYEDQDWFQVCTHGHVMTHLFSWLFRREELRFLLFYLQSLIMYKWGPWFS